MSITACHWDSIIPFDLLWEQYKRIIKPNGAIALFGSQPFTSALVMSNPKWFKYEWIWEKASGSNFAAVKYQPLKEHESIVIFSSNSHKYFPIKEVRKGMGLERLKNEYKSNSIKTEITGMTPDRKGKQYGELKNPSSVQYFNNRDAQRGLAPTQKPVKLYEYLAKTYTLEGELILDNTAGSGTLAIGCINTNRRYICIEKDPTYFEVMRNRIANHDPNAPIKTKKPKAAPKGQLALF